MGDSLFFFWSFRCVRSIKGRSDFRIVADYFVQMRMTGKYVPLPQDMVHAREVLQLMSVLAGDDRFEKAYNESKKGEEPRNMCEVLDLVENRGIEKGKKIGERRGERRGEIRGIRKGRVSDLRNLMETMQWSLEQAMDALKISGEERRTLSGLLKE